MMPDPLRLWLVLQAESSAFKEVPVIVMSSENDSSRIKRYLSFTSCG